MIPLITRNPNRIVNRLRTMTLVGVTVATVGLVAATDRAETRRVPTEPALPASYVTQRTATERALADLARREGLTGLSPLSLRPIDADIRRVDAERALAEIAATEGLTGLSPVSLRPITPIAG